MAAAPQHAYRYSGLRWGPYVGHALGVGEQARHAHIAELGGGSPLREEHVLALQVAMPHLRLSRVILISALIEPDVCAQGRLQLAVAWQQEQPVPACNSLT